MSRKRVWREGENKRWEREGKKGGEREGRREKEKRILICFGLLSPFSSLQNMPGPYLQMIKIILS